jgi:dTDP-4-dehydrorhamnose reductase
MSKAALVEAGFKPLPRWQDAVGRYLIELQSEAARLA